MAATCKSYLWPELWLDQSLKGLNGGGWVGEGKSMRVVLQYQTKIDVPRRQMAHRLATETIEARILAQRRDWAESSHRFWQYRGPNGGAKPGGQVHHLADESWQWSGVTPGELNLQPPRLDRARETGGEPSRRSWSDCPKAKCCRKHMLPLWRSCITPIHSDSNNRTCINRRTAGCALETRQHTQALDWPGDAITRTKTTKFLLGYRVKVNASFGRQSRSHVLEPCEKSGHRI